MSQTPTAETPPREPGTGPAGAKARYLLLSLAVLVLDQWSKWLVELHLGGRGPVQVVPGLLNFTHVENTGVAFGLLATHGHGVGTAILTALGVGALIFVAYYFRITPPSDRLLLAALGLILGGAVGNLLDRVVKGAVTDFVDFYFGTYHWHTFNVADSAITIGIGLMILGALHHREPKTVSASP
jgi:signal peptidase II